MTLRLITGMRDTEFVPVFLTQRRGPLAEAVIAAGIETVVLPLPALLDRYDGEILRYSPLRKLAAAVQLLVYNTDVAKLLKREQITAIWCSNIRAVFTVGFTARVLRIPLVWNIWLARQFSKRTRIMYKLGHALASRIVTEYQGQPREVFTEQKQGGTDRKISTVYTGIGESFFGLCRDERNGIREQASPCEIVTCCRITPRKDLGCLLEAVRSLSRRGVKVRATILGSPFSQADKAYHRELLDKITADGTGASVRFAEWTDDVRPMLAEADLYVSTSLAEGLPGSIREAQAAGIPAVATDAGGTREAVLDGVTGILVPLRDAKALADAIERLATDHHLAYSFGEAAKKRAAQLFSTKGFIQAYANVFRDTLKAAKLNQA